ncbi:hypothetical protein KUTeg_022774, partial [Tegillarca granosa]
MEAKTVQNSQFHLKIFFDFIYNFFEFIYIFLSQVLETVSLYKALNKRMHTNGIFLLFYKFLKTCNHAGSYEFIILHFYAKSNSFFFLNVDIVILVTFFDLKLFKRLWGYTLTLLFKINNNFHYKFLKETVLSQIFPKVLNYSTDQIFVNKKLFIFHPAVLYIWIIWFYLGLRTFIFVHVICNDRFFIPSQNIQKWKCFPRKKLENTDV